MFFLSFLLFAMILDFLNNVVKIRIFFGIPILNSRKVEKIMFLFPRFLYSGKKYYFCYQKSKLLFFNKKFFKHGKKCIADCKSGLSA